MPATLDDFKRAFAAALSDDFVTACDDQAVSALKALKKSVGTVKDGEAAKRFEAVLVELVRRYDEATNDTRRPNSEIAADLAEISRAVVTIHSELKKTSAARSSPGTVPVEPPGPVVATQAAAGAGTTSRQTPKEEVKVVENRRGELKQARAAWVAVKTKAEQDLEQVKEGARREYLADAEQYPRVVQGCQAIDDILDHLDDELRDTLDQYVSTPVKNQNRLIELAAAATAILDRYLKFVAGDPLMKAIDRQEFADVTVHAPVMKALQNLRRALS